MRRENRHYLETFHPIVREEYQRAKKTYYKSHFERGYRIDNWIRGYAPAKLGRYYEKLKRCLCLNIRDNFSQNVGATKYVIDSMDLRDFKAFLAYHKASDILTKTGNSIIKMNRKEIAAYSPEFYMVPFERRHQLVPTKPHVTQSTVSFDIAKKFVNVFNNRLVRTISKGIVVTLDNEKKMLKFKKKYKKVFNKWIEHSLCRAMLKKTLQKSKFVLFSYEEVMMVFYTHAATKDLFDDFGEYLKTKTKLILDVFQKELLSWYEIFKSAWYMYHKENQKCTRMKQEEFIAIHLSEALKENHKDMYDDFLALCCGTKITENNVVLKIDKFTMKIEEEKKMKLEMKKKRMIQLKQQRQKQHQDLDVFGQSFLFDDDEIMM